MSEALHAIPSNQNCAVFVKNKGCATATVRHDGERMSPARDAVCVVNCLVGIAELTIWQSVVLLEGNLLGGGVCRDAENLVTKRLDLVVFIANLAGLKCATRAFDCRIKHEHNSTTAKVGKTHRLAVIGSQSEVWGLVTWF